MTRLEAAIVTVFLGAACLLLACVLPWWVAAAVGLYFVELPVEMVIAAACAGLGLGVLLNTVFLRRWVTNFYGTSLWPLTAVYLALSVIAIAFFMGLPVGTFALGILAGAYMGTRQRHHGADAHGASRPITVCALLTAVVTTAAAAPVGIMALDEQSVATAIAPVLAAGQPLFGDVSGLVLVGTLCAVLFLAQYAGSKLAGRLAWRLPIPEVP